MNFAKWVFRLSGIWGILILVPLYFLMEDPRFVPEPTPNHPDYYFGFLGVALAFQFVFLIISADPLKYRVFMLPSICEKFLYVATLLVLYSQGRIGQQMLGAGALDLIWGVLFIASFLNTRAHSPS